MASDPFHLLCLDYDMNAPIFYCSVLLIVTISPIIILYKHLVITW